MRVLVPIVLLACGSLLGETRLGKPLISRKITPIAALLSSPGKYVGKTVQVRGQATEVCEKMGCWTSLVESASGKRIRIKVVDGEIVFPKDAVGKTVIAEGVLAKVELTKEQAVAWARHEAEEQGRKFDPATVKSGTTFYQIEGSGTRILD